MPVSAETYERLVLEDPEHRWELHCGRLVERPDVTSEHADAIDGLYEILRRQIPRARYAIRVSDGHLRCTTERYFNPDLIVFSRDIARARYGRSGVEILDDVTFLVVEVWSPSTGEYDTDSKIPEYRQRGDLEIWRIHPYERTLTAWRKRPDGGYDETLHTEGLVPLASIPGVTVDLAELFS